MLTWMYWFDMDLNIWVWNVKWIWSVEKKIEKHCEDFSETMWKQSQEKYEQIENIRESYHNLAIHILLLKEKWSS